MANIAVIADSQCLPIIYLGLLIDCKMTVVAYGHPLMAVMLGGNPETTDDLSEGPHSRVFQRVGPSA